MNDDTRFVPEAFCPNCGCRFSAASGADGEGATPAPGDMSVCFRCGLALVFDERLRLRRPRRGEVDAGELARIDQWQARLRTFWALQQQQEPRPDEHGRWPCGCRTWAQSDTFMIRPCSPQCGVYKAAIAATYGQGKAVVYQFPRGKH